MRPIAYILKMFPRFSETFVLSEILELERQGVPLHIFSLKRPDDGVFHGDAARVRTRVTYLPDSVVSAPRAFAKAHLSVYRKDHYRYRAALRLALARRRAASVKRFLQAGYIAPLCERLDVAHVHAHFASAPAAVAQHLHRLTGIPFSFTAHAKDIYIDSVDRSELRRKLGAARFAITVSDYNRRHLEHLTSDGRIVRIYNGLDLGLFSPNARRADPPLVLAVGRLIEKKGFDDLVRACALLRDKGCRFLCQIVGKGPLDAELRGRISELGLDQAVELTGPIPRESLLRLYPRAAVVVAPCVVGADGNRDGLPTVLIEAMALGVPVVATGVTGIPELVVDGETGLLVPQHDPSALATAIRRVLTERATGEALARAGREHVEREFELTANVSRLRSLFEETAA